MENLSNVALGLRPILLMILAQLLSAGMILLYKLASVYGMPMEVLIAYRFMFASVATAPFAYFLERNKRPKLTWMVILQTFGCALFGGSLNQDLYAESVILTSATFATAMINLVPGLTFILAILFRLENREFNSMAGKAKVVGTFTSIAGAMLLTIYKGVEVKIWSTNIDLLHKNEQQNSMAPHNVHHQKTYLGSLVAVGSCLASAFGLILRAKTSVSYPCYSSTALMCFFGAIQTTLYALWFERDWSQWKLGWDIRLLASIYGGIVASGLVTSISMYCVQVRGPLFVSIFSPLMLIIVAVVSSIFLMEKLYLGSVLGAAIIIIGLYIVIWGKRKELKKVKQLILSKGIGESELGHTAADNVVETRGIVPTTH